MGQIPALVSFTDGTTAKAPEVNANFAAIRTTVNTFAALVDTAATITGAWTFSTSPTIPNALTVGNGLTVTAGASSFGAAVDVTGTMTATNVTATGALTGATSSLGAATATSVVVSGGQGRVAQVDKGDVSGSVTINWNEGNCQRCRVTLNTTFSFSNAQAGGHYTLVVTNAAGSPVTSMSGVAFEGGALPVLDRTNGRSTVFAFYGTGGATPLVGVVVGTGFQNV